MRLNPFRRGGVTEERSGSYGISGLNDPTNPLYQALVNLSDGIGMGGGAIPELPSVTMDTATRLSAVYRCVSLLSVIATLPLDVFDRADKERTLRRDPNEAYIWRRPNPEHSRVTFWSQVVAHLALDGNAYLYIVRDSLGRVVELWPVHPRRVRVIRDSASRQKVFTIDGQLDLPFMDVSAGGELVHIMNLSVDGLKGLSPIGQARVSLQRTLAAEQYGARFFANGAEPGGILSTDSNMGDVFGGGEDGAAAAAAWAAKVARQWEANHKGAANNRKIAVLDGGLKYQAVTMTPSDAKLLELMGYQVEDIARLFGVPPHLVGTMAKSTSWGSGLEEQNRAFVQFTLTGYTARIEQAISDELLFPVDRFARFDYRGMLRSSTMARFQAYRTAGSWLTTNEIRELEDLPGVGPEGDVLFHPMNEAPLDEAAGGADNGDLAARLASLEAQVAGLSAA